MVLFLLGKPEPPQKAYGSTNSGVDQPCVAGQNLALSIRTVLLS
jgi:hypothetical protein